MNISSQKIPYRMNTRVRTMILFNEDKVSNLLPKDGTVYYYGKVLSSSEANLL